MLTREKLCYGTITQREREKRREKLIHFRTHQEIKASHSGPREREREREGESAGGARAAETEGSESDERQKSSIPMSSTHDHRYESIIKF